MKVKRNGVAVQRRKSKEINTICDIVKNPFANDISFETAMLSLKLFGEELLEDPNKVELFIKELDNLKIIKSIID